jgi:tRNA 5-methylaminomethyl-2-thiouridine biosynthesis bifunctional protein
MSEPLDWSENGPRSPRFGDVYFSTLDGLAESRSVFLAGCGLPEAWAGRACFTVAELGFGTGLNVLALLDLWRRTRAPGARLSVFSIEAFPIAREDAARALAAWPELADLAAGLLAQWPEGRRGLHRIDLPDDGAILDLAVADAETALAQWDGAADAWFLDGFSPAKNPQMWREPLMALVAARSRPGARAATFTVAGAVRRSLQAAGFTVEKRPGFGRKRERLEARLPGEPSAPPAGGRVAIVGGGIAGASLARAVAALGGQATVYEAQAPGAGASGNPAALVTPRLDAGLGPAAALHAQAFARAARLYRADIPDAILAEGVLQLARNERDPDRFARIADWEGFGPGAVVPLGPSEIAAALGEPAAAAGLAFRDGLVIEPPLVLDRWLAKAEHVFARVARLEPGPGGWRLLGEGGPVGEADAVVIAAGAASGSLAPLPLQPVRGQASWAEAVPCGPAAAWGGYAIPTRRGVLFGATHDRGDETAELRSEDHARNLALLATGRPRLAAALEGARLGGRASVRAAAPDHLPLAGAVPQAPGLFVLTALGGRGFTLAPLLAEEVAAQALGRPRPLPRPLAERIDPARPLNRHSRRVL